MAATKISDWVNGILPDLEMPDKMIQIEVLPLGIETQLTSSPIATVPKVDGEVNNDFRDSPLKVAAGAPPEGSVADDAPAGLLMDQAVDRLAERLFAELAPLQKKSAVNSATVWGSSIDPMDEAAAAAGGAADRNDAASASGEAGHRHLVGGSGWDLVRLRIIERRPLAATATAAAVGGTSPTIESCTSFCGTILDSYCARWLKCLHRSSVQPFRSKDLSMSLPLCFARPTVVSR